MKFILPVLLCLIASCNPDDRIYSSGAVSIGTRFEDYCSDIIQTSDYGYVMVGNSNHHRNWRGGMYAAKLNVIGNKEWTKSFFQWGSTDSSEIATGICENPDSTLMICGFEDNSRTTGFILKTDKNGNWISTKKFEGIKFFKIKRINEKGYIVTGSRGWYEGRPPGSDDLLVSFLDMNLNPVKTFTPAGLYGNENGLEITAGNEGDYGIPGNFERNTGGVSFTKISAKGVDWSLLFKGHENGWGRAKSARWGNNGYVIAGSANLTNHCDQNRFFLAFINEKGVVSGNSKIISLGDSIRIYSGGIVQSSPNSFFASGIFRNCINSGSPMFPFLMKFDSSGNIMSFKKLIIPARSYHLSSMIPTRDGGLAIGGTAVTADRYMDFLFIKIDSEGRMCSMQDIPFATSPLPKPEIYASTREFTTVSEFTFFGSDTIGLALPLCSGINP